MSGPVGRGGAGRGDSVAVILKGYPRLSETFIAQEIRALEKRGFRLSLVSLRHPTDKARHPIHAEIAAPVAYLPEYLYQEPLRVWRGWRKARRLPGYAAAKAAWLADWRRDPTPNRGRRFGQALVLAAELPAEVGQLYAHFLHTPASVARYTSLLTGLPWACSAHAKDIWTTPDWEIAEKLASLSWLVTCTKAGLARLRSLAPDADAEARVALAYHGLDFARLPAPPGRERPGAPLTLLTVGRLVEKKGIDDLLEALARLPEAPAWRWVHIGGGPLKKTLAKQAERLGLAGRIEWRGAQPAEAVFAAYREADLFVLAAKVAASGDRDGLPNVLMEAQSQALPVVASRVAAIPELIADGETGLLVPPEDPAALAAALARLMADPALARRLGQAGAERVRRDFGLEAGIATVAARLAGTRESQAAA